NGTHGLFNTASVPKLEPVTFGDDAIKNVGWNVTTPIQERAIPLALEGKDLLAHARTGSGKTGAYVIPMLQKLYESKMKKNSFYMNQSIESTFSLVLAPTKELCAQATRDISLLANNSIDLIDILNLSAIENDAERKKLIYQKPLIIISTPAKIVFHLKSKQLIFKNTLKILVADEADLLFTLGYEKDIKFIKSFLPNTYQCFLLSATLNENVEKFTILMNSTPTILTIKQSNLPDPKLLSQYCIKCEQKDKFLLLYCLLKLNLIVGRTIIFVNSIDRCYRLKLFLSQFGISCCVLNSMMPVNSRLHVLEQFNIGLYSTIIASDESISLSQSKNRLNKQKDIEYSVSRGIDFQNVSNVINFDFPKATSAYIHRVGRTARANASGTAISLVSFNEYVLYEMLQKMFLDCNVPDLQCKPYQYKISEIEGFRYRVEDCLKSVTKLMVKNARLEEIKNEMINSKKLKVYLLCLFGDKKLLLKNYFKQNPRDFETLRHDQTHSKLKIQTHLNNIPDYLLPDSLKNVSYSKIPIKKEKFKAKIKNTRKVEKIVK
ncbi:ATP-dependent RNA helicase DBP9, partial [Intoshia linei]